MRFSLALIIAASLIGCSDETQTDAGNSTSESAETITAQTAEPQTKEPTKTSSPGETNKAPTEEHEHTVQKSIQGKWVIVEANMAGNAVDEMKGGFAVIAGNEITVNSGGQQSKSTLSFQDGTNPIQFDAQSANGQKLKAIMRINGDEMTVSTSLAGIYPTTFDPGPSVMVLKYKRE